MITSVSANEEMSTMLMAVLTLKHDPVCFERHTTESTTGEPAAYRVDMGADSDTTHRSKGSFCLLVEICRHQNKEFAWTGTLASR